MLVEALFWFYPMVWLIGARLIVERERACDESVLARGHDREVYAGGILKVYKFCLQSPLACSVGMSGGNLGHRGKHYAVAAGDGGPDCFAAAPGHQPGQPQCGGGGRPGFDARHVRDGDAAWRAWLGRRRSGSLDYFARFLEVVVTLDIN